MLWKGEFTAGTRKSAPLAAGRVLGFLDYRETLRVIRLTGCEPSAAPQGVADRLPSSA